MGKQVRKLNRNNYKKYQVVAGCRGPSNSYGEWFKAIYYGVDHKNKDNVMLKYDNYYGNIRQIVSTDIIDVRPLNIESPRRNDKVPPFKNGQVVLGIWKGKWLKAFYHGFDPTTNKYWLEYQTAELGDRGKLTLTD